MSCPWGCVGLAPPAALSPSWTSPGCSLRICGRPCLGAKWVFSSVSRAACLPHTLFPFSCGSCGFMLGIINASLQHELSLLGAVQTCFDLQSRCQQQMEQTCRPSCSVPCQVLGMLWFLNALVERNFECALELGMYQRKLGARHQNVLFK